MGLSNAEGMKLLTEFVEVYKLEFVMFLLSKVGDETPKVASDIQGNLATLAEGGHLSGGL